ncbi:MAG: leucine-rich repeat domain-containing protein, partial [Bacteroidales bacterium]|nr:leucine-rich repeat domain-containing protein [Bacteroidales bacterium]
MRLNNLQLKRAVSTVLIFVLLNAVGMTKAFAQSFTVGDLNYSVNSGGTTVTVTGHVDGTAATGELVIPETVTYNGSTYSVTKIGFEAFRNCTGFIGNLVIPSSVTSIGSGAFGDCTGFTGDLVIPNSVTSIGNFAFSDCYGFTGDLVIPNSVTTIGSGAFWNCTGFTGDLTIGNSVTTIGSGAFEYCSGFTGNLVIPNSVTTIGSGAFEYCTGFSSVEYNATDCADASSSWPPFQNCGGQLTIGENVERIPANMFRSATFSLILCHAEIPPTVGTDAFYGISHNIPVYVPCGSLSDYQNAEGWNVFNNISVSSFEINVGDLNYSINCDGTAVTVIGHVNGTAATGELVIPETVTYNGLTYSVTAIGDYAFYHCTGFTGGLVIPNSVTTIGRAAFYHCTGFTGTLVVPNSVTSIGGSAFRRCTGFSGDLIISNSVTTIGSGAFVNCTGLTGNLVIPNSV